MNSYIWLTLSSTVFLQKLFCYDISSSYESRVLNKVNECNKKRLFSISGEFTEILKKYFHQLQIDEGRDKDVYPF